LKSDGIEYIGDLVVRNENDMLRTPNFGRKSLNELKQLLSQMKLKFGMNIEWPPKDMKALQAEAKRFFEGE
jgi:DNA-directed RNA polymerase subunit alpha